MACFDATMWTKPASKRLVVILAACYLAVPPSRGVVLAMAAAVVLVGEYRARKAITGVPVQVLVDGVLHRVPSSGGAVAVGDRSAQVRRRDGKVLVDDEPIEVGGFVYHGASQLEVLA